MDYNIENDVKKQKEYREHNKEKLKEMQKQWRLKNLEKLKKYNLGNKEIIKIQKRKIYQKNKEKYIKRQKEYYQKNKDKIRKYNQQYQQNKFQNDINYKLGMNIRNRIKNAIKIGYKKSSSVKLLGCDVISAKQYLEKTAPINFLWSKYGVHGWHIDHIKPCISFDLTKEEEQKKCFHYTNLQMMWCNDNWSKGGKLYKTP